MLNKELLLSGNAGPHVIMTIDYTSDNLFIKWGYNEGAPRPGAVNRKPYWTKGSGAKLTFNMLVDFKDNKSTFYGTGLNFNAASSHFTTGDSFRLTRADTKEVIELVVDPYNITTYFTAQATVPFFHDLGQGDSVGIFFDPPPDGYL